MQKRFTLSKKEKELMSLLWEAGEPLPRTAILERAEEKVCSWKPNSIHILLNALMDKGAVEVAGVYAESRKLGRTFRAVVSQQEYAVMQVELALLEAQSEAGLDPKKLMKDLSRRWDDMTAEKRA